MASPPWNFIIERVPDSWLKLKKLGIRILKRITVVAQTIAREAIGLPRNISCSDPRVIRLKQLFAKLQKGIEDFLRILPIIVTTLTIFFVIAQAASAYLAFQNSLQFPTTPGINAIIEAQAELLNDIIDIIKDGKKIITFWGGKVIAASMIITGAVNIVSQICNNDVLIINQYTKQAIDKISAIAVEVEGISASDSRFYQDYNVSEADIKSRADIIDQLMLQQRSMLDLVEAPSQVILVSSVPEFAVGVAGDYAINRQQRIIYGPKPSDTEWNLGIKY